MNQGRVQPSRLLGRRSERETLDGIVTDALAGQSRVIVVRGEAGIGKSALLGHVLEKVAGWHVATAVGVESEMELAYSGLHQLCGPMLDHLDRLPIPQREALATVFGQSTGPAPDRFLVGLAALTLFAEIAEQQPLVCIVDDAQWLDRASAQILGFVARRLLAERIALVCATAPTWVTRPSPGSLSCLSTGSATAMRARYCWRTCTARSMRRSASRSSRRATAIRLRSLSCRAAGAPQILLAGSGCPTASRWSSKIEQSYVRRLRVLPSETQLLVLAAAAEPLGDPVLLHRAAETLGVDMAAADPAVDAGLLKIGGRVEFAHPLVRSAAYRSAAAEDRHRVHRALAEATDPETDPDRRAWHRARATPGPGEEVAAELERSAGRAQARGGVAAAAAFLQRAVAADSGPGTACGSARWPRRRRASRPANSTRPSGSWPRRRPTRSTVSRAHKLRSSEATLPWPRPTATMLPRCFCKPQEALNRSTSSSLAGPT